MGVSGSGARNRSSTIRAAGRIAEATDGKDPELVIAALLHDAIEDQEVPKSIIAEGLGAVVAGLVDAPNSP